ncbi:MAG: FtsK/SpoIIIE domain-containing protein [Aminipila sp.]
MVTEALIISGVYVIHKKWEEFEIRWAWKDIVTSHSVFTNAHGKTLKILKYEKTDYGYDLTIQLPYGYTLDAFHKHLAVYVEGLELADAEVKPLGNAVILKCIKKRVLANFEPKKLPPHVIVVGKGLNGFVTVDMNKFPHCLIGGDTGTGKSRLLFTILSNLVSTTDQVEIKLIQMRKNDLEVFSTCRQVESSEKDLENIRDMLKRVDEECSRRETLIRPIEGNYNIADYNKNSGNFLNYIYVVIEEFSFLNLSAGDTKAEKRIKNECLKYIKGIVNVGRSSGVFFLTALQKPTKDSLPSDIKAQLTTRISLTIKDQGTSQVILGNGDATNLGEREVIIRTLGDKVATTFTIEHEDIINAIKDKIIDKPKKEAKTVKKAAIFK